MRFSFYKFFFLTILFISIFPFKTYPNTNLFNDAINPYCSGKNVDKFLNERKIKNIEIITDKKKNGLKMF